MENIRYAIGIYKKKDGDCDELVGYAPAGVLSLPYHFLQTSDDNCVEVEILGKRKLEVGLVVLVQCLCNGKTAKMNMINYKDYRFRTFKM